MRGIRTENGCRYGLCNSQTNSLLILLLKVYIFPDDGCYSLVGKVGQWIAIVYVFINCICNLQVENNLYYSVQCMAKFPFEFEQVSIGDGCMSKGIMWVPIQLPIQICLPIIQYPWIDACRWVLPWAKWQLLTLIWVTLISGRADRDDYVNVLWDNIEKGLQGQCFLIATINSIFLRPIRQILAEHDRLSRHQMCCIMLIHPKIFTALFRWLWLCDALRSVGKSTSFYQNCFCSIGIQQEWTANNRAQAKGRHDWAGLWQTSLKINWQNRNNSSALALVPPICTKSTGFTTAPNKAVIPMS